MMVLQAVAGLISDARQLAVVARTECSNYRSTYGTNIPVSYLNDRLSMSMHVYTLYSAVRPYGCSVILGSYDEVEGPAMYMIDPSGVSYVSKINIDLIILLLSYTNCESYLFPRCLLSRLFSFLKEIDNSSNY